MPKISPHSNAPPPGHTCHGVTTRPCMSHLHRFPPTTFTTLTCLSPSSLSLFATGFPVTPPEPGPAPSPASGFRPSGLQSPVSPGVPTGARNLGVLVIFHASSLLSFLTAVSFPASLRLSYLCYRPPDSLLHHLLTHPRVSLAHFLPIPTDPPCRPPKRGPTEKVGSGNRGH